MTIFRERSPIRLSWFAYRSSIHVEFEFGVLSFAKEGKPEKDVKENHEKNSRTNNKLNSHVTPS